ncbi:MAG: hypothetical protein U5N26_06490 [Candidatus Marinimicrobia bacterium]|nr:hypothetical protein [Candidatus Neomarinimicrobiota bacterium]
MPIKAKTTIAFLVDILLLAVVVLLPGYLREGEIPFNAYYALFFVAWIFLSFIFGKYRFEHRRVGHEIIAILLNAFVAWGLLSLFVISFEMYHKSYDSLFLQILLVVGIEIISRIIYYLANRKRYRKGKFSYFRHLHLRNNQWGLMFLNLLWVFLAFMFLIWLKPATLRIYLPTFYPYLIGLLIWEFIINLFTGKHRLAEKERFRDFLVPIIRANIFTFFLLAILVYLFHFFDYSRLIVFGTVVLSTVIECIFALYISLHSKVIRNMDESETILAVTPSDAKEVRADDTGPARYPDLPANEASVLPLLEGFLAESYPRLFTLLKKHINVRGIRDRECMVLDTQTVFNIENIPAGSQKLLINLHKVNDFKRINDYFELLNEKIESGGYLVSSGETIKGVYAQFLKRYPRPFGRLFYFLHFLFRRVLPKLPVTREINYFFDRREKPDLIQNGDPGAFGSCRVQDH